MTDGVPAFSPSFSWPRFFPFGHGPVNEQAVQHYDDVISEMHANGIRPAVTVSTIVSFCIVKAYESSSFIGIHLSLCLTSTAPGLTDASSTISSTMPSSSSHATTSS